MKSIFLGMSWYKNVPRSGPKMCSLRDTPIRMSLGRDGYVPCCIRADLSSDADIAYITT